MREAMARVVEKVPMGSTQVRQEAQEQMPSCQVPMAAPGKTGSVRALTAATVALAQTAQMG